jgi:hypothetical protein
MSVEDEWREPTLRSVLRRHSLSLSRSAGKLALRDDFPSNAAPLLARTIQGIAELVHDGLHEVPPAQVRTISKMLEQLGEDLRYVDRSRVVTSPWSLVECIESFMRTQIGRHVRFLIRPKWSYNYSITNDFVASYKLMLQRCRWLPKGGVERTIQKALSGVRGATGASANAERAGGKSDKGADDVQLYCLSFPRVERANPLLHANLGHEVGHIVADRWNEEHFDCFWKRIEDRVSERQRENIEASDTGVSGDLLRKEVIENIVANHTRQSMNAAKKGLVELFSDAVGVHLFVPAALAAIADVASRKRLDESPISKGYYPPWRYRLRLATESCRPQIEPLREQQLSEGVTRFLAWFDSLTRLVAETPDFQTLDQEPRTVDVYRAVRNDWEFIRKQALSKLPGPAYSLADRWPFVRALYDRLEDGIPPNEAGEWAELQPASLPDILNAVWISHFRRRSLPATEVEGAQEMLHRLVLKAIESSHVQMIFGPRFGGNE